MSLSQFGGGRKCGLDSTKKFKLEAVRLVKSSGNPMSQIARELGVSDSGLDPIWWRE